jgi:hypothetical protein
MSDEATEVSPGFIRQRCDAKEKLDRGSKLIRLRDLLPPYDPPKTITDDSSAVRFFFRSTMRVA